MLFAIARRDKPGMGDARAELLAALDWDGPVHEISAISSTGTDRLCADIMVRLETLREEEESDPEAAAAELARQQALQAEARERIAELRLRKRNDDEEEADDEDDFDDDDYDVDVEYVP